MKKEKKESAQLNFLHEYEYSKTPVFAGITRHGEMVSIKHLSENLGISRRWQQERIQNDPYLSSTGRMEKMYSADGKYRETYCLPAVDAQLWLWSLKPTPGMNLEVWENYKKGLVKYLMAMLKISMDKIQEIQDENHTLKQIQALSAEIENLRSSMDDHMNSVKDIRKQIKAKEAELKELINQNPNQLKLEI